MKRFQYRRLPMFLQLALFIVALLALPLGFLTYASSARLLAYSEEAIIQSAQDSLHAKTRLVDNVCDNILYKTINFTREPLLNDISTYTRYDEMQAGPERSQAVRRLATRLKDNAFSTSMIHSIYFWLQGSDYLVTTRNDTVRLEDFYDLEWMSQEGLQEASPSFRNQWLARKLPYETIGEPVGSRGYMEVITYLYRMTNYTTDARGILAVNLYEKDIRAMLNEQEGPADSVVFLMDKTGLVVSHPEKDMILANLSEDPAMARLMADGANSGWFVEESSGTRTLYCWTKAAFTDWYVVGRHSFDTLLNRASAIRRQTILLAVGMAILCLLLVVLFSRRVTHPITRLMQKVMTQAGVRSRANVNEIEYLTQAFDRITEQEAELNAMLRESESSLAEKHLLDVLHGEVDGGSGSTLPDDMFPHSDFQVALVAVDRQQLFHNRYTRDQRQIMRSLARQRVEAMPLEAVRVRAVLHEEDRILMVLNFPGEGADSDVRRHEADLLRLQQALSEVFGGSVSIGVSAIHQGMSRLRLAAEEASDSLRRKWLNGHGTLLFHKEMPAVKTRYFYPFEREKHLLNLLTTCDPDRIRMEVTHLAGELRQMNGITPDNVLQIYNGMISASLRYCEENNIHPGRAFPNLHAVYLELAWQETLEDFSDYLMGFYEKLLPCVQPAAAVQASYPERIMACLNERYRTEIDFERIAEEIGISYSYFRKIVKDETGKSPLDYVNILRIQEAKRLLRQTTLSVQEVALNLGYANAQSLTRFFKKFEGITPGEFRTHQR